MFSLYGGLTRYGGTTLKAISVLKMATTRMIAWNPWSPGRVLA